MSHAMRIGAISVATLAALWTGQSAAAAEDRVELSGAPMVPDEAAVAATLTRANPLGVKAVELKVLARKRGGTDGISEMQLKGVVADNRAVNVTTGGNIISDGAFANSAGLPMVVQNTGNNVLIQNATIVNVQVK